MAVFGKRAFCKCSDVEGVKVGSAWVRVGPKSDAVCPSGRQKKDLGEDGAHIDGGRGRGDGDGPEERGRQKNWDVGLEEV